MSNSRGYPYLTFSCFAITFEPETLKS